MSRLLWNSTGENPFEAGVDLGVLYFKDSPGLEWPGLVNVVEDTDSTEDISIYINGDKILRRRGIGHFTGKVQALYYPEDAEPYLESYTLPNSFGMSYRTLKGSDPDDYEIHIIYNALAFPETVNNQTITSTTTPISFSWTISTVPVNIPGYFPGAHFKIDSKITYPWLLTQLEDILYGTDTENARLPNLLELLTLFEDASILKITDNGDGTWTAETRPEYDAMISIFGDQTFSIDTPSTYYITPELYSITSL